MYSTILKKIGKCRLCSPDSGDKYLIAGLCQFHYKNEQSKKYLERQKERNKIRLLQNSPVNKSMTTNKKTFEVDEKLEQWFKDRRKDMIGICSCGCGQKSSKRDDKFYKCSAAHLFAKKNFKSIMYHPLNFVELNFWQGCHTTFDQMGYEYCKETKPVLWSIVVERFKILYPLIAQEEYQYIPKILIDEI